MIFKLKLIKHTHCQWHNARRMHNELDSGHSTLIMTTPYVTFILSFMLFFMLVAAAKCK